MNEIYWKFPTDTAAFFSESLLQFVARTYYRARDNFNDSRSLAWAGDGWVAFRSGLIGNLFGVHVAAYTSQKLFGPVEEDGTKLLAPGQNSLGMLGQVYGRAQILDQEFRGGRTSGHPSHQSVRHSHGAEYLYGRYSGHTSG
jgi:hypothetical protein